MNCKINTSNLSLHIKSAIVNAKVNGITGQVINFSPDTATVLFTFDNTGEKRNQIFPVALDAVEIQIS